MPLPYYAQIAVDILAGTAAGLNVTFVGHPFDTMKVKMQMFPGEYDGFLSCAKSIIKNDGIMEFYRGVSSPIVGQIIFRSILFGSQNWYKRLMSENGQKPLTTLQMYMSGAIAWGIGTVAECPIDVVKCQLQVQRNLVARGGKVQYQNTLDALIQIIKMRGIKGLYQGVGAHLMRNVPGGFMHIGTYEYLRSKYMEKHGVSIAQVPLWYSMIAGAIGGVLFWAPFFPFDCVKNVIQSQNIDPEKRDYKGYVATWKKLYREGGINRFYAGFSPCMVRAVPANAVLLVTASESHRILKKNFEKLF